MKRTLLVVLLLGCGRSGLERDGQAAISADAGTNMPGPATCELPAVCNASTPLAAGHLTRIDSDAGGGLNDQQVVFDAQDRAIVGFRVDDRACLIDNRCPYVVRRLEDGEWKSLGCGFDGLPNWQVYGFRLVTDRSGAIAVMQSFAKKTRVSMWKDNAWVDLPDLPEPGGFTFAMIDGQPLVPWTDGHHAFVSRWNGTQWQQLGGALETGVEAIAVDAQGVVVVAGVDYVSDTEEHFVFSRFDGSAWTRMTPLIPPHSFSHVVQSLKIDHSGNVWAAFIDLDLSAPTFMYSHVARFDGDRWTLLPDVGTNQSSGIKDLVLTSDDRPVISISLDTPGNQQDLGGATIAEWNGTGWDRLLDNVLAGNVQGEVSVDIDSHDRVAAGWEYAAANESHEQVWLPDPMSCQ
jgi:hypothetical protein